MTAARRSPSAPAIFCATVVLPLPVPPAIPRMSGCIALEPERTASGGQPRSPRSLLAFARHCRDYLSLPLSFPSAAVDCLNLVGGEWRPAVHGGSLDVRSPYD